MTSLKPIEGPELVVYHVSPRTNARSILERGVDPSFSKTARPVSWWATAEAIYWAIAHVACRRELLPCALDTWRYTGPPAKFHRTRWPGVLTTTFVLVPHTCFTAELLLAEPELVVQNLRLWSECEVNPFR